MRDIETDHGHAHLGRLPRCLNGLADALRQAHHAYQATVMDRFVTRGPLLSDDGLAIRGSLMIMEYPDRAALDAFWDAEPLQSGGVFGEVRISRWRYGAAIG